MQGEPPTKASAPTGAVFLSYASQDVGAAQKICEALRAAGIEVWFDQSELRGGDAWDHKIRDQIHACRLFIPVISANTERRDEGYFRREWSLAVDRTRDMVHKRTFLVPVAIDGTAERGAAVPEKFHELQWTRLPSGETPPAFVDRIGRLLSLDVAPATTAATPSGSGASSALPARRTSLPTAAIWGAGVIAAVASAYFVADRFWLSKQPVPHAQPALTAPQTTPSAAAAVFNPPPHSIAVLPFVNMSGDKEQEYFSEGLTEELLDSLSRINELQVAARTSSFSFQGEHPDIGTVARKLNVGAVLEGSVRRSANTIRVSAQLVSGVTGFHLWSETYDRDIGNVLKLQTEIATAVASAMRVTLLADEAARIEVGGTHNPAAFDAYLRATKTYANTLNGNDVEAAIASYGKAIALDPNYALAYAERSTALSDFALNYETGHSLRASIDNAEADARRAIALAPGLGLAHLALAIAFESAFDFRSAHGEYERAMALAPGNAEILTNFGLFAVSMGNVDAGLAALQRAVTLDSLNANAHNNLGLGLRLSRRYKPALEVLKRAEMLNPEDPIVVGNIGVAYYLLGDYESARKTCEKKPDDGFPQMCLAVTYDKLGRHGEARAILNRTRAYRGDAGAVNDAWVLAQWGQTSAALDALETAMRVRSPYLEHLKTSELFDPLRKEPRFQAVLRGLNFPE